MKIRKVGVLTSAIALIAIGIVILLQMTGVLSYDALRYVWPIVIILFGLEIIWTYSTHKEQKIQYSGWSIALLVLMMVISFGTIMVQSVVSAIKFGSGYAEPVKGQVNMNKQIRKVDIELPDTPVKIVGTNASVLSYDGIVQIKAASKKEADHLMQSDWTVRQEGDTLVLTLGVEASGWNFDFGGWTSPSPHLDVQVPQALLTHVVTSNSSVHVTDMHAATEVHTSNGSITLANIQANATAGTMNGRITLQNIAGKVDAGTTNGSIKGSSMVGGNWTCTTTNGAIKLEFINGPSAKITASTNHGRIGGNVAWTMDDQDHGTVTLRSGANAVALQTTNGSVAVKVD